MNNKTQRSIHKYFFSHYFCFVFFRKNNIRGNAATNNTPNEGEKDHRGKVKEVEKLQYFASLTCVFYLRHSSNWNPHRLHSEPFSAKRKTQRRAPPIR
jgi:hypothetical protein